MTESVTIPGKETMKDHVKPNGPIPSDTHPRVEHRSRKTKGPEESPTMTQATLPTMNATGSTIPTGPRRDHRPNAIELCDRIARQMRRHNLAHRNEEGDAFCWCGLRFATLDGLYRHCARHYLETMDALGRTSRRTVVRRPGKPRKGKRHERRDEGRMPHRMSILPCQRGIRP